MSDKARAGVVRMWKDMRRRFAYIPYNKKKYHGTDILYHGVYLYSWELPRIPWYCPKHHSSSMGENDKKHDSSRLLCQIVLCNTMVLLFKRQFSRCMSSNLIFEVLKKQDFRVLHMFACC